MSVHDLHDPSTGKLVGYVVRWREGTRNRSKTFTKAKFRDAKTRANDWQRDVDNRKAAGMPTLDRRVTVAQLATRWKRVHVKGLAPGTQAEYTRQLRLRILPMLGHYRVADVDRKLIAEFVAAMRRQKASAPTIHSTIKVLKVMLGAAVEWEMAARNVAIGAKLPKLEESIARAYTPAEVQQLAAACTQYRDAVMIVVAAFTGLRWGEVAALKWSDITADGLRVERAVDSEVGVVGAPKTRKARTVPLFDTIRQILDAWHQAPAWEGRWQGVEWVFPSRFGSFLDYTSWHKRHWKPARAVAGLPDAKFHWLRHTFASTVIAQGATALQAKTWLGHSSITMTYDTYGHLLEAGGGAVGDRVDALAAGSLGELVDGR